MKEGAVVEEAEEVAPVAVLGVETGSAAQDQPQPEARALDLAAYCGYGVQYCNPGGLSWGSCIENY